MQERDGRGVRRAKTLVLLVIGVAGASCLDHADPIVGPEPEGLLGRYVALGNSITAAFQSEGIHEDMQRQAYPVLLAAKAGAPFGVPALAYPGCPPPLVEPLTRTRIAEPICAGLVLPGPPLVQNLAVPGATVAHALLRQGTGSGLDRFILGDRSQVEAMLAARPTLVSVWLGNNDALRAALYGDPSLLTPLPEFRAAYDQVVEAVRQSTAQDAILIGVADAAVMAPALQPGAYFWALARQPDPPVSLDVGDSCAPFDTDGAPNPGAFRQLVSFLKIIDHLESGSQAPVTIECAGEGPYVLTEAQQAAIADRVGEFNAHIRLRAEENGWIYLDPGASLVAPALARPDDVRKCQMMEEGQDEAAFFEAVRCSCPSRGAPNFYGALFSFDGVHPSSAGHAVIADTLAGRLNAVHGLALPVGN
jgi:lysophospholipase L1-like esterase